MAAVRAWSSAFGTQVRKGGGCLFTLSRIPIILAQKEVLQIVVVLMTKVGKNTSKANEDALWHQGIREIEQK